MKRDKWTEIENFDIGDIILYKKNKMIYRIYDIKFDFKQVIDDNTLPFLNIKSTKNLFFEYIKYNCSNYYKLKKRVNKENEEYLNELEEEEQEYYDLSNEND